MNSKLIYISMFAAGAVTGSAATWYYLKDKYAKLAQEEIDSVKERFEEIRAEKKIKAEVKEREQERQTLVKKVEDILNENNYTDYSKVSDKKEEEVDMHSTDEPYVIPPEEFGEYSDYEQISLTYYSDGVLTDEDDNIIDDVAGIVGAFFMDHFGEYEDDSVFVRNDVTRCEYEILADERRYVDAVGNKYANVANQDYE